MAAAKKFQKGDTKERRSITYLDPDAKPKGRRSFNATLRSNGMIQIMDDGENVTPFTLNPMLYEKARERQMFIYENDDRDDFAVETMRLQSSLQQTAMRSERSIVTTGTLVSTFATQEDDILMLPMDKPEGTTATDFVHQEVDPSGLKQQKVQDMTHVSLVLVETDTDFILDMPSSTVARDDAAESDRAEADNKLYEYLTVGKGRNRKTCSAEVQTVPSLVKSRETDAPAPRRRHNYSFASEWDMYDTYNEAVEDVPEDEDPELHMVRVKLSSESLDSIQMAHEEMEIMRIVALDAFFKKLCVVERLLAGNNFQEQQKRFRGLCDPSPFREKIEYNYRLNLLWTFANDKTQGRCVTGLCWNPVNKDILAVGYGKFYYHEKATGMIMLWNVKNPVQPERIFNFPEPVTSLDFSQHNPNLLAVGFNDGSVQMVDVSGRQVNQIARSSESTYPSFEPIWQAVWFTDHDYFKGVEFLLTACQDGRISKFRIVKEEWLHYSHMMRVAVAEGNVKGLQKVKDCKVSGIAVVRCVLLLDELGKEHLALPYAEFIRTKT